MGPVSGMLEIVFTNENPSRPGGEGVESPLGIMAIEWADKLDYLPSTYLHIYLTYTTEHERSVELVPVGRFDLKFLASE